MNKAETVFELLGQDYGIPGATVEAPGENPLFALIEVIVAQNTSRPNRNKALSALYRRFSEPGLIAEANIADVIDALYPAGLANVKAPRLQGLVAAVLEATHGSDDLTFLYDLPTDEAFEFLTSLPGIGQMSASLVLLFTMGREVLPVNTGLHRVAQRLGLVPQGVGANRSQWLLQGMLQSNLYRAFHINMVRHAREVCHAARPACERCCLAHVCNWAHGGWIREELPDAPK